MDISIYDESICKKYHSKSQIARVLTESWFQDEMYCPNCLHEEFVQNPNNTRVSDFVCNNCKNEYQLKAQSKVFHSRVVDGAYAPLMNALKLNINPSFGFMSYSSDDWLIENMFVVPKFFFSQSIIEKRKPLSATARRAGWIGCNILLSHLPQMGKIDVVSNGKPISKKEVNQTWKKLSFLDKQDYQGKAWTSDVLFCIQELSKEEFTLDEVYSFENYLSKLHPDNHHVKDKIRQQLQILRDKRIIKFKGNGTYLLP